MITLEATPQNDAAIRSRRANSFNYTPQFAPGRLTRDPEVSVGESISAGFQRDSMELALLNMFDDWKRGRSAEIDPNFNAYSYMKDWDADRYNTMKRFIADGYFDDMDSPEAVEVQASRIENDMALEEKMAANPWSGFVGQLGANIFTITNFLPIAGAATKGRLLGTVGKMALGTALSQVPNELALQAAHPLREWSESVMNIGTAGVIGGGLGVFGKVLSKGDPLHPSHGRLSAEMLQKEGVSIRELDGEISDVVGHDARSVGAAASGDTHAAFWGADAPKLVGEGMLSKMVSHTTPLGRTIHSVSDTVRKTVLRLADPGGLLMRASYGRTEFKTGGLGAEDRKAFYLTYGQQAVFRAGSTIYRGLGEKLGQIGVKKLSLDEFQDMTSDALLAIERSDAETTALTQKYGEQGLQMIDAEARKWSEVFHRTNSWFEEKLVKLGYVRDKKRVDISNTRIKADTEKVKALQEQKKASKEAAKAAPADGKEAANKAHAAAKAKADEEIDRLRIDIASSRSTLQEEMSKAPALGRDYGLSQTWQRESILMDRLGFRNWLINDVLMQNVDDEWLMMQHGLTQEALDELAKSDPAKYKEITSAWAGDDAAFKISRLEGMIDLTQAEMKSIELDLNDAMNQMGWTKDKAKFNNVALAKAKSSEVQASIVARRTERQALARERDAINTAMKAGMQSSFDRANQLIDVAPDVGAKEISASEKADAALVRNIQGQSGTELRHGADKQHNLTAAFDDAGFGKAAKKASDARDAAFENPLEAPAAPGVELSPDLAKLQGRLAEINKSLTRLDADLADDIARLDRFKSKIEKYESRKEKLGELHDTMKAEVADLARERKITETDLNKMVRELKKVMKRGSIENVADDIINSILDTGKLPTDLAEHIIPESGRLKQRRINLTPAQRKAAKAGQWLDTDLARVGSMMYSQMAGHIGLREAFDIRPGGVFKSWTDVIQKISNDYKEKIDTVTDAKTKANLGAALQRDLKDIETMKNRLLGLDDVGLSKDSMILWASRKARQANFIRFGSDFLVSSLTDLASVGLRHSLLPTLMKFGRPAFKAWKDSIPTDEIAFWARTSELAHGDMGLAARIGDADALQTGGVGFQGTTKQRVTAAIDMAGAKTTDLVTKFSAVPAWNTFWKSMMGYAMTAKLAKLAGKEWGALTDMERATLQGLGLDTQSLKRLNSFFKRFGETEDSGIVHANTDEWVKHPGGQEALEDYFMAITRDQKRGIVTIGVGDTPRLMDNWAMKSMLQFQSFSFAATNKYLIPLFQRFAMKGERLNAAMNFAMLMSSTIPIIYLKEMKKGNDPMELFNDPKRLTREMIDRSGLLAYTSPFVNAGSNFLGLGSTSRFQQRNWYEGFLGPQYGLVKDVSDFAGAARDADVEKAIDKATRLMPFGPWFQRGQHLFAK